MKSDQQFYLNLLTLNQKQPVFQNQDLQDLKQPFHIDSVKLSVQNKVKS